MRECEGKGEGEGVGGGKGVGGGGGKGEAPVAGKAAGDSAVDGPLSAK